MRHVFGPPQPDKLKAFELYGKPMGYYAERREVTSGDGKLIEMNNHITVEFVEPEQTQRIKAGTSGIYPS
jgi:hypothetical protein